MAYGLKACSCHPLRLGEILTLCYIKVNDRMKNLFEFRIGFVYLNTGIQEICFTNIMSADEKCNN